MQYSIILRDKNGDPFWHYETLFPFMVPDRILPLLMADWADKRGFCKDCNLDTHCHPLNERGFKYCTILFYDAVRPAWKLEDVA